MTLDRRTFLAATGALAAAGLTGCGGSDSAGPDRKLVWWDHNPNLQPANKSVFAEFAEEPGGLPVEYTHYQTSKLGQALKLAKQSNQLPDIHSTAGL